jgi:hypothetical protein
VIEIFVFIPISNSTLSNPGSFQGKFRNEAAGHRTPRHDAVFPLPYLQVLRYNHLKK